MTGSLPNQTIVPAVTWAFYNLGKRFYLIGDNEIFGQTVGEIVCGQIDFLGGELAGQTYVSADPVEIATAVEEIKAKMPSVIVNFLDGEHNKVFFQKLRAAGVTHAIIPTVCYSLNETEIVEYGVDLMIGDYSVVNYYQTLESPENISFIERFTKKYGSSDVINDTMQASYDNVYLWARAVEKAGTTATDSVRKAIKTIAVNGPGGIIYLGQNLYAWLNAFIAQIRYDGKFDIVWSSKATMTPEPFLPYKSKEEWKAFLDGWYKKWGNRWEPK
jgi:urea transport system substrate-binding protein